MKVILSWNQVISHIWAQNKHTKINIAAEGQFSCNMEIMLMPVSECVWLFFIMLHHMSELQRCNVSVIQG